MNNHERIVNGVAVEILTLEENMLIQNTNGLSDDRKADRSSYETIEILRGEQTARLKAQAKKDWEETQKYRHSRRTGGNRG